MRALVLDGCAPEEVGGATSEAVRAALEQRGRNATVLALWQMEMAPCAGCFGCWFRTPGECVIDDVAREVARAYVRSDLVVLVTPIRFGGYGYHLKKAVDRLIPVISPLFAVVGGETHHLRRYDRYPAVLGVGLLPPQTTAEPQPGLDPIPAAGEAFCRLVERNAINMRAPRQAAVTLELAWDAERSTAAVAAALARLEGAR